MTFGQVTPSSKSVISADPPPGIPYKVVPPGDGGLPVATSRAGLHYVMALVSLTVLLGSASILFYSSGYKDLSPELHALRFSGVGLGSVMMLLVTLSLPKPPCRRIAPWLLVIWSLFSASFVISSYVHATVGTEAFDLLWMAGGIPLVCFYCGSNIIERFGFSILLEALAISNGILLLISLIDDPNFHYRYMGLFGDPNQLGPVGLMLLLWAVGALYGLLLRSRPAPARMVVLVIVFLLSLLLIFASSHRTSMVAAVSCTGLAALSLRRRARFRAVALLGIAVVLGVLIFGADKPSSYVEDFLAKGFGADRGFLGREAIWRLAVSDPKFFGNGREYFLENAKLGAHNSFLHVFGTRGYLACGLFVLLCGYSVRVLFIQRRLRKHSPAEYVMPMMLLLTYWELSLTEGMFSILGNGIQLAFLIALGALAHRASVRNRDGQSSAGRKAVRSAYRLSTLRAAG